MGMRTVLVTSPSVARIVTWCLPVRARELALMRICDPLTVTVMPEGAFAFRRVMAAV